MIEIPTNPHQGAGERREVVVGGGAGRCGAGQGDGRQRAAEEGADGAAGQAPRGARQGAGGLGGGDGVGGAPRGERRAGESQSLAEGLTKEVKGGVNGFEEFFFTTYGETRLMNVVNFSIIF